MIGGNFVHMNTSINDQHGRGIRRSFGLLLLLPFFACSGSTPKGVATIEPFDATRYMGKWYEIARLDHKFERGLTNVTAEYSLKDDGGISVVNRGYDLEKGEWKEADGKAEFVDGSDQARLKVSFFGPFYSGYNVIALDDEYRYSMVTGDDRDYLWLLSREKEIPEEVKQRYLKQARDQGYDVDALIWVEHDRTDG